MSCNTLKEDAFIFNRVFLFAGSNQYKLKAFISSLNGRLYWIRSFDMTVRRTGVDGKLEGVGQSEARPREAERGAAAEVGGAQTAGPRRATLPRATWGGTTKTHRRAQIAWQRQVRGCREYFTRDYFNGGFDQFKPFIKKSNMTFFIPVGL